MSKPGLVGPERPECTRIRTDCIRRDGGTQMRTTTNEEAVSSYAERIAEGDVFPPVVVFFDGSTHWLADGFHRVAAVNQLASRSLGTPDAERWIEIGSVVHSGTREDAIRYAISANRKNGLRRTNADKQMAVRAALAHPAMKNMSDQAIADEAGVSAETIRRARTSQVPQVGTTTQSKITTHDSTIISRTEKRTGTDGKMYPAKAQTTTKKGRPPSKSPDEQREAARVRMAERRAAATGSPVKHKTCPMCNGKGFIHD